MFESAVFKFGAKTNFGGNHETVFGAQNQTVVEISCAVHPSNSY